MNIAIEEENKFNKEQINALKKLYPCLEKFSVKLNLYLDHFRLVGGIVRNFLLNENLTDIDIATNLPIKLVKQYLSEQEIAFFCKNPEYETLTAILDDVQIEITSLRKDIKTFGRSALTKRTDSWLEDAKRRDFTFNALYMDFSGKIYDYFSGIEALERGEVIFIGDPEIRIKEDFLRILRYYRFVLYYNKRIEYPDRIEFSYDQASLKAVKKHSELIKNLSKERITEEFTKILKFSKQRDISFLLKDINNLLEIIFLSKPDIDFFNKINIKNPALFALIESEGINLQVEIFLSLTYKDIFLQEQIGKNNTNIGLFSISKKSRLLINFFCVTLRYISKNLGYRLDLTEKVKIKQNEALFLGEMLKIERFDFKQNLEDSFSKRLMFVLALLVFLEREDVVLEEHDRNIFFRNIMFSVIPKFPLNGDDLKVNGKIGKNIGMCLDKAFLLWVESGFLKTKQELINSCL